ncbi:hypothetical protein [Fundidesulfovibrio putealis]|uniref:hypothetical protein n=1 Tax=Fundidesulfovibrio putealis TaxID=270496 RepID=UPI000425CB3E|nr:hypothetical protein [Fundidesulfovibrio putealis]
MNVPTTQKRDKSSSFLSPHREDLVVVGIWVLSLVPAFLISVFKKDPLYASFITILIQFLASFGTVTLFGVITQLICYRYIESSAVHDRMMDGLFYGFHAGMIIWMLYAFFTMLFGLRTVGEINTLIGFFGIMCILSCMVGILVGFIVGNVEERKRSKGF